MSESASSTALVGQFLDLKTGQLTRAAQYLLQQWQTQLAAGFDSNGNLISNLSDKAGIVGRTGTVAEFLQFLTAQGVIEPKGLPAATPISQGAVILPSGAVNNTLGTASTASAGAFDPAGAAAVAQSAAQDFASIAAETAQTNAENFAKNASNITTGLILTSLLQGLTATVTTAQLTVGGANGSMTFTNGLLTAQVQST